MSKGAPKKPKQPEGPQAVAEVFSLGRDIEVQHPYHLDGDMEMYSEEKMEARNQLRNDEEILKQLKEIGKLYTWSDVEGLGSVVLEKEYKRIQRHLARILRPQIEQEELQFVVDTDWQHDSLQANGVRHLTSQKLEEGVWELVDVWTAGTDRSQYVAFCRLLKKKLARALKAQK